MKSLSSLLVALSLYYNIIDLLLFCARFSSLRQMAREREQNQQNQSRRPELLEVGSKSVVVGKCGSFIKSEGKEVSREGKGSI